jgi:PAS domain S-box-containing protein
MIFVVPRRRYRIFSEPVMKKKTVSLVLLLIALVIIIVVHLLDYRQSAYLVQSFRDVEESQQTLIQINKLGSLLKDVQRAHRGYVITGQQEFLAPYEHASAVIPDVIHQIQLAIAGHNRETSIIDSLSSKASRKIELVEEAIIQVNTGRQQDAVNNIRPGKKLADEMFRLISELESNEKKYTTLRSHNVQRQAELNFTLVIAGLISSAALLIVAMASLFRNQTKVEKLSQKLEDKNRELGTYNEELKTTNDMLEENRTKLIQSQQALEFREKQLLQAQQISKTGSVNWNLKTDQIEYTPEFARIMNIKPGHPYNFKSLMTLVHPEETQTVAKKIESGVKNKTRVQMEFRLLIKTAEIHVLAMLDPYLTDGELTGYLGTLTDVTEQRKAVEELRLSEQKFRALLEAAPEPIIIASADGIIQIVNQQTEKLFKYAKEELINQSLEILIPYRFKNESFEQRGTSFHNPRLKESGLGMQLNGLRKDGHEVPIEISLNPLESKQGVLLMVAVRDVTLHRKAEQKILEANEKLHQANEALRKVNEELNGFAYSISHDLKAPLRVITGFSEMLSEDYGDHLDESGKKALNSIQQNTKRMDALINDLLDLAKLGAVAVQKQRLDMQQMVEQVLEGKALMPQTEINVMPLSEAQGDPSLLRQVLENLIENAIKFSSKKEKPVIEIGTKSSEKEKVFWIRDNGAGFDPAYSDKLFKVFSRLHTKKEFEGTGAGLAIAKKIIDAHGGKIWADAKVNEGATFYFSLPY